MLNTYSIDFFLENIKNAKKCSARMLCSDQNKKIIVAKIFNYKFMQDIYKKCTSRDNMIYDKHAKLVITYLLSDTRPLINLFCCNLQMIDIYDKLSTHGIAIEGNFNINPLTKYPIGYYEGKSLKGTKIIKEELLNDSMSYLVIDNHQIINIMYGSELIKYKSTGIYTQCVQGDMLIKDGKDILIDNDENDDCGMIVIAKDENNNTLIIYHQKINKSNMLLLLHFFKITNAIIICKSDTAHIVWKESEYNFYNKTDFIGNMYDNVSNIITFSS